MNSKLKILMVEDLPSDAELIQHEIRKNGIKYIAEVVETRNDFIEKLNSFQPDIILSDYSLPQFDGFQALLIRKQLAPLVPFILVTGSLNEEIAVTCMKEGADDYILKENLHRLSTAIKSAIEKKETIKSRLQAEHMLRESEARLQRTFDFSPTAQALLSEDFKFIRVNKAMCRMLNYSEEELLKMTMKDITHPDDVASSMENSLNLRKGKVDHFDMTKRYLTKDNNIVWGFVSVGKVNDQNGNLLYFMPIITDITQRVEAEEKIKNALNEKEILLKEIHHRVKNNFQIISSLLILQSDLIQDKKLLDIFKDTQNRIKSMAFIHELMFRDENISSIDFTEYVTTLIEYLQRAYPLNRELVEVSMEIERVQFDRDLLIPIGIIINELVSNVFKHAFPNNMQGKIAIKFKSDSNEYYSLIVADNGKGMESLTDSEKSLGLILVKTLVKQMNGKFAVSSSSPGTEIKISFKRDY